MTKAITLALPAPIQEAREAVLNSLRSKHSRRAYRSDINQYISWCQDQDRAPVHKPTLEAYKRALLDAGKKPRTIARNLAAIRAFIRMLGELHPGAREQAEITASVKAYPIDTAKFGRRLLAQELQDILDAPDSNTAIGARDSAILAMLAGCMLRRDEVCALKWSHLQKIDGHYALVDLVGKGGKSRTIGVPDWVFARLMAWGEYAHTYPHDLPIFQMVHRSGKVVARAIHPQAIYKMMTVKYGFDIKPHDLRRTGASLARKAGVALEQIQRTLGHAQITTTELYTAIDMDLDQIPGDMMGVE